jgi:hypothetical protein
MQARRDNVEPFPRPRQERSLGALFSDLASETSLLIRQEISLAKAEVSAKVGAFGAGIGMLVAGGLIAWSGLLVLLAAGVLGLSKVVEPWLAALIVGGAVLVIGAGLAFIGKGRMSADKLVPHRTIRSLKDDSEWAKEQMR